LVSKPFEDECDNEEYKKQVEELNKKFQPKRSNPNESKTNANARRCIYALKVCEDMVNKKQAEGYLLSIFDPANTLEWNESVGNNDYEKILKKNVNIKNQKGLFTYCKKMINDDNQSAYSLNDYFENNKHHKHYPSCNIELIQFVFKN